MPSHPDRVRKNYDRESNIDALTGVNYQYCYDCGVKAFSYKITSLIPFGRAYVCEDCYEKRNA